MRIGFELLAADFVFLFLVPFGLLPGVFELCLEACGLGFGKVVQAALGGDALLSLSDLCL